MEFTFSSADTSDQDVSSFNATDDDSLKSSLVVEFDPEDHPEYIRLCKGEQDLINVGKNLLASLIEESYKAATVCNKYRQRAVINSIFKDAEYLAWIRDIENDLAELSEQAQYMYQCAQACRRTQIRNTNDRFTRENK